MVSTSQNVSNSRNAHPPRSKNNKSKIAENVIYYFKTKLNTKWMDLCTSTALKETVLVSFEYYSRASKQFPCIYHFRMMIYLISIFITISLTSDF